MSFKRLFTTTALSGAVIASLSGASAMAQTPEPWVSATNTGQALIFPYYTVNDGWATTLNVMNTSPHTLAVKVRFREKKNSRDVLDFNIVMSPYDAWAGIVQNSPDGPQLFTPDNSCTSPLNVDGVKASRIAYTGEFNDGGGDGAQRMRDGYVEMMVMGIARSGAENVPNTIPYWAKHVNGMPRDCVSVDRAFEATESVWSTGTDPLSEDLYNRNPQNLSNPLAGSGNPRARDHFEALTPNDAPLKGNLTWLKLGTGTGAGTSAIPVSDWSRTNFVTAQQFPWFLEPTFASSLGLWTIEGIEAFEQAITWAETSNEWANNPESGAQVDWVITFPTKAYHADRFNTQIQAAVNRYRNRNVDITANSPAPGVAPFEWPFGARQGPDGLNDSPITVEYTFFDREEASEVVETDGTTISPAPPQRVEIDTLRFEANVVQFGERSVFSSHNPAKVDPVGLLPESATPAGWAKVRFVNQNAINAGGLPVTAFAIKARTAGEAASSYGQAMENSYAR